MKRNKISMITALLAFILFVGLTPSYAGDVARTGTAAGVQVLVPVGARYLAMGGANIAEVSGVDGIFWNPAGLSSMKGNAAGVFSSMNIFDDVHVNYLGLGFNMGSLGNLGVTIKAFDFGDIPLTTVEDPDGASGRTFSPTFTTIGLAYSIMLTNAIQVGFNGKMIYESIDRATASAFAVDAGIQYHGVAGINGLSLGMVIKNVGTNMQYNGSAFITQSTESGASFPNYNKRMTSSDQLPASFELGLGYKYAIDETNNLLVSGNFANNNFGTDAFKFGAEYMFKDMLALRAGYVLRNGLASEDQLYHFTIGAGFNYNIGGADLTIDYAYRDSKYFNGNNLFSLKIGF